MSNSHGQISRLGLSIQFSTSLPGFPGWAGAFNQGRLGTPAANASQAMAAAGNPAPNWLGRSQAGNLVTNREMLHFMTRYPGRNYDKWRYAIDLWVGGQASHIAFTVWAAELYRNSHRGIDAGAQSGWVEIEYVDFVFMDGGTHREWSHARIIDGMNGWYGNAQVFQWTGALNYGRPVKSVRFSLVASFGSESYHDCGDGVPGTGGWTPGGILGNPGMGVGFNYAEIADSGSEGLIDRETTYMVKSNPGFCQHLPFNSLVGRSGEITKISSGGGGGGGYTAAPYRARSADPTFNLW